MRNRNSAILFTNWKPGAKRRKSSIPNLHSSLRMSLRCSLYQPSLQAEQRLLTSMPPLMAGIPEARFRNALFRIQERVAERARRRTSDDDDRGTGCLRTRGAGAAA